MENEKKYVSYVEWKDWSKDKFGFLAEEDKNYFDNEISPFLEDKKNVLEIGFGNGNFLRWAKNKNLNYVGVELIDDLIDLAKKEEVKAYKNINEIENQEFDIITAFDVFEHIDSVDLINLLKDCNSLLKEEGFIIARFPNGNTPLSLFTQNGDYTHVNYIGSSKIDHISNAAGLQLFKFKRQFSVLYSRNIFTIIFNIIKLIYNVFLERFLSIVMYKRLNVVMSTAAVAIIKKRKN